MHRARLVSIPHFRPSLRLLVTLLVALVLTGPRVGAASSIASRVLIDPEGENNADFFGTSIAWVGDINTDGYDDILVGAFRYPEIGSIGRAYVYFGGPAMDAVADLVISPPAGGAGWFGVSVGSAGDFNGDGAADFIVGARQAGNEGRAFIYYGGPSLDTTPDVTLIGESTGSLTAFGAAVASAGDLNQDGFDDVIVGAPQYGVGGRVYVYFGGAIPDAIPDRVFTALGAYDELGDVVGSAGDMNGDGHPDLFASAPANDAAALNAGAIYVWFGGPGFDTNADLTLLGSGINEHLMNAANAGDVNGDGFSDLIGAGRNQVRVWFGGSSPNATSDLALASSYSSVAGAGDVNGDGIDDFVVGAPLYGTGGRASFFFGGSAVDMIEDMHFVGDQPGISLGQGVAGGGHVDGQGPTDLVVSSYYDPDATGYNRGRVFVFANSLSPTGVPLPAKVAGLSFAGARPNPASHEVRLVLELSHSVPVRITVYDLTGHEVARPVSDERLTGRVTRVWRPGSLPSGVYYVRAALGDLEQVRKVIWLGESP